MMKTSHLSHWEQEEYVMRERTPLMVTHLAECSECRAAVEQMEQALGGFRTSAVAWSSESLARRSTKAPSLRARAYRAYRANWAWAALIPIALLMLVWVTVSRTSPPVASPVAAISDDALLDQVDEQLSVAVPSSMESLTHLVSTGTSNTGGKAIVQSN